MNEQVVTEHVDAVWVNDIVPALVDYISIPNVSMAFDADWVTNGHMHRAVDLIATWCRARAIDGLELEVIELDGRSPLVFVVVPATAGAGTDSTVLLYGHLDKQPEMTGWRDGLGPWTPVIEGDRLYGRGGGDDGYSAFAALTSIEAVEAAGGDHARCVVIIEASEESGSHDLPTYVEHLARRLGSVGLVICLDSACGDYEHLWVTTSLRGLVGGTLTVKVLENGVHSGVASGVAPSSFRIIRQLLDRVEDATTGRVLVPETHVTIPANRRIDAAATSDALGHSLSDELHFAGSTRPMVDEPTEHLLNTTWRPTLSYTGIDGMPPTTRAGNVLRPMTALKLSFRLPPTCNAANARQAITEALTVDPPSGADVGFDHVESATGWDAPAFSPWLAAALDSASHLSFGTPARALGEGGSIPFMAMLGQRFPDAQFVVTGILGPESNAHGPNEFVHLPTAKRLTAAISRLLNSHARFG